MPRVLLRLACVAVESAQVLFAGLLGAVLVLLAKELLAWLGLWG